MHLPKGSFSRSFFFSHSFPTPFSFLLDTRTLLVLLLLPALACVTTATTTGTGGNDPVQRRVDRVHAQSFALRQNLLTAWTFEADATPSPGYYSTFAGAPIQHIIAAMAHNGNATAVALAQTALANPNMSVGRTNNPAP